MKMLHPDLEELLAITEKLRFEQNSLQKESDNIMMIKESMKDTFSGPEFSDIKSLLDKFAHDISEYGNALGSLSKMFQRMYDIYTEEPTHNLSDSFK